MSIWCEEGATGVARLGSVWFILPRGSVPDLTKVHSESSNESRGQKRSLEEPISAHAASQDGDHGEPEDGLKLWGYMPGHVHYKVGAVAEDSPRKDSPTEASTSNEVDKVLPSIPPRSITGMLSTIPCVTDTHDE